MCGYIKDDLRIARYLGMCPEQVASIRANIPKGIGSGRPPSQFKMATNASLGVEEITYRRMAARKGSEKFLKALRRAGA